jgi:hypothetical protein
VGSRGLYRISLLHAEAQDHAAAWLPHDEACVVR